MYARSYLSNSGIMGLFSSNVKCCRVVLGLLLCLTLWTANCEAGGPFIRDPFGPLVRLLKPHPPPPPPPPLRAFFYPQPGPITSVLPPYIHGHGVPLYSATKFVVARNHHHGLPQLHLQDPDLVRFFYQQAPAFFNVPSLSSLYALPHGPPTFFDYPGGFGSFEKYTGPSTTFYKGEPDHAPVVSEGGYGGPSTVTVSNDEYEPPSSGGYSSPVSSGGYGAPAPSSVVSYDSGSGSSSAGGYGGGGSSSSSTAGGGYDRNSDGYGGPPPDAPDSGSNADANPPSGGSGADAGANQNPNPTGFDGSNPQETGPSGRASSDRQEEQARPRPEGAAASAAGGSGIGQSQRLTNDESDFQDEPEIGFRSLTSGSFRQQNRKEKGRTTTSSTNDGFADPKPTKDPFKSSAFLSQFIDSSQYQKKHSDKSNIDGPIQFRSPLSDADLFDYGDELIDTAAGGEKTNFGPKQQKKPAVVTNKGGNGNGKQNNKKTKPTSIPHQDQVFFDEVEDRRNADSSSKEESDPKPTNDYDQVLTTGASFTDSGEQKSGGPVKPKPTPTSGGYSSSTTSRGSSSSSTTTEGGYDDVKPTDGAYEDSTNIPKNGNFGTKIKPTSTSPTRPTSSSSSPSPSSVGANNNRQKKAAQARTQSTLNQRPRH